MKNKGILLLYDHYDTFKKLTAEEIGLMVTAMFEYDINGTPPEFNDRALDLVFDTFRRFLDGNRERYEKISKARSEVAKKRWSALKELTDGSMQLHTGVINTNANTNTNSKSNANSNVNVNVNSKSNATASASEKETAPSCEKAENKQTQTQLKARGIFENVFLSDEQMINLREKFNDADVRIDSFSAYMKAKNKSYANHYAQLLNWQMMTDGFSAPKDKRPPGERREPTFDVSAFTKKAVGIKYVPPT